MKGIDFGPNPEILHGLSAYEAVADGSHLVSGIFFQPIDNEGTLGFRVNNRGELTTIGHFVLKNRPEERNAVPKISLSPVHILPLLLAFSVPIPVALTKGNLSPSRTLEFVQDIINTKGKPLVVETKGGWVKSIPGATPPKGAYYIKFVGMQRPDRADNLDFQPMTLYGQPSEALLFKFEIVEDASGDKTFAGFPVVVWMKENPFETRAVDDKGASTPIKQPVMKRKANNGLTPSGMRWYIFIKHFCEKVMNHEWITDPLESPYGVNEAEKPQYVINDYALKSPPILVLLTPANNLTMTFNIFNARTGESDIIGSHTVFSNADEELSDFPTNLQELIEKIQSYGNYLTTTDPKSPSFSFTPEGKEWAKKVLTPICQEYNIPTRLLDMKESQIDTILSVLKAQDDIVSEEQYELHNFVEEQDDGWE